MQLHIGDLFISKNTAIIYVIIAIQGNSAIVMIFDYISLLEEVEFQTGLMFLVKSINFLDGRADESLHLAYRHE